MRQETERLQTVSENTGKEDLKTNKDQDDTAKDSGFARQLRADLFADGKTGETDHKGDSRDQQHRNQCGGQIIVCDGKANG